MSEIVIRLVVVLVSLRVSWWHRRLPLDRLIDRLRRVRVLPEVYRRPEDFERVVNLLHGRLPPRGLRSCLKRVYLLLDLWSRCGLEPEFHLGVRKNEVDGHAWLTVEGLTDGRVDDQGYEDVFVA